MRFKVISRNLHAYIYGKGLLLEIIDFLGCDIALEVPVFLAALIGCESLTNRPLLKVEAVHVGLVAGEILAAPSSRGMW